MKKYRIKSKFRFTMFVVIMLVSVIFTAGTALGFNTAASLSEPVYTEVRIKAGDTLWQIADEYGPEHKDRRQIVYEICKANDIRANDIHPGQLVLVPQEI